MPRFLANSFLGLSYIFKVQAWYICLNLIDMSKKGAFCVFKTEFKAKILFARNLGMHFRRAINLWGALLAETPQLGLPNMTKRLVSQIPPEPPRHRVW
jgi:hypothetical protein